MTDLQPAQYPTASYPIAGKSSLAVASGCPAARCTSNAPIVRSPATAAAFALAEAYAAARTPVVLVGPSGSGKSYLAEYIHRAGPRAGRPLVERTGAEITPSLAAAQLFGYERGAFTGAVQRSRGAFGEAANGTLLLDDLHLMEPEAQALLLRALSSSGYRPLGAERDCAVGFRLLVGLRECPDALMDGELLLPDLRYRLGHCVIRLPSLAERSEEIRPLARAFLARCPAETGVPGPVTFGPDVVPALERLPWPGNLRDLKGAIEAAFLVGRREDLVRLRHFPADVLRGQAFRRHGDAAVNRHVVADALEQARGCASEAARLLGVHRNTVARYVRERPPANP